MPYILLKMIIKIFPIFGFLHLIPLTVMLLTGEVNWSFFDYTILGALLTITGLLIEITLKIVKSNNTFIIIIIIVTMSFLLLLIWAELAVGLFGTPFAGN